MATEVLRNRSFLVYTNDGTATAFGDWLIVPNTGGKVSKATLADQTPVARVYNGNQFCGPYNPGYYPEPGTQLAMSCDSRSSTYNYSDMDNRRPIMRIQIGSTRYADSATPATEPNILGEWRGTGASEPNFGTAVVNATVPETYDPESDAPVYAVYYAGDGSGGVNPRFYVAYPSLLATEPAEPTDEPPSAPTGLTEVETTTTTVEFSWTAGTDDVGVAGYNVYRDTVKLNSSLVTTTSYTDTDLTPDTEYSYTVRAVDTADQESTDSTALVVTTDAVPSDEPPTAPTGLTADKTHNTVVLSWTPGTDDDSVAGYRVYRDGVQVNIALVTGTTYTNTGLTPETEYSYTVRTQDNAAQLSDHSTAVVVTTLPEPPPPPSLSSELAQRVAAFLGAADDVNLVALAQESVSIITAMVRSYTRGHGFLGTEPENDIAAVITTASARLVANPEQMLSDVGTVSTRSSFQGFTLAELFVLNRYRVRAQ